MSKQLWWMQREHIGMGRRLADFAIAFATSAILGLGTVMKSGGTTRLHVGSFDLSVPLHGWQYALWAAIAVAGGCVGAWIMSFGGHEEVTLLPDGVRWTMGRATRRFYPYAQMQRCDVLRSNTDDWLLRIVMQPDVSKGNVIVKDMVIAPRMDPDRVRAALRAVGVTVD